LYNVSKIFARFFFIFSLFSFSQSRGGGDITGGLWLSGGFCCVGSMKMLPKGHVFREIFGSVEGFAL
jgi:hypothetical protein